MTNLDLIANQLRALPRLAQEAAQRTIDVSHNSDESGIRTAPTSRMPPGVNLDRIDLDRGREWPALLAQLGQCIRVVCQECPDVFPDGPQLSVEGRETWAGECTWLLATMHTWRKSGWCVEWIGTEVATIHRKLAGKIERKPTRDAANRMVHTCSVCGGTIEAYATEAIAVAECGQCERIIAMRARPRKQAEAVQRQTMQMARAILGLTST